MAAAIVLLAAVCYGAANALTPKVISEKNILYSYDMSIGGNYEVSLMENELYPEKVLGEDCLYARSLMDKLHITFRADYSGSQPASISGNYSVAVVVQGYQTIGDSRKVIYERSYPVATGKPIQGDTGVKVSETVVLNINTYKSFADKAEQILNAKPSREARVIFSGVFSVQTEYGELEEPFHYSILIPLTNELFSITKDASVTKTDAIAEMKETTVKSGIIFLILPVSGALGLLGVMITLVFFTRPPNKEEQYALDFKTIQRKHGSRMVKLHTLSSSLANMQVMVSDLDSLIKISDERQQPVCYVLNEEGLPAEGLLYVPDGERHYMLYLKK